LRRVAASPVTGSSAVNTRVVSNPRSARKSATKLCDNNAAPTSNTVAMATCVAMMTARAAFRGSHLGR
jgi:hypothetical protein